MRNIAIVVPTLEADKGRLVVEHAVATAGARVEVVTIVVEDSTRQGFTKTANEGIRQAPPDSDVCLLNDDVTWFPYGWLEALRRALYKRNNYGITAPSGASGTAPLNTGALGDTGLQVVHQVPFWCALMKRDMLNALGLLDEEFIHYASDNYYCYRMRKAKWRCVWVKDVFLGHRKHGSGRQNKWRDHDHKLLRKKMR